MRITLKEANLRDADREYEALRRFPADENGFMNPYCGCTRAEFLQRALPEIMKNAAGIDLRPGRVPQTLYFLWDGEDIVGLLKFRPRLNDALRAGAGHVGYGILPEYRGRGYAKAGLAEILRMARGLVEEDALYLSVNKDNPASLRVQLANGAIIHHEDDAEFYTRIPLRPLFCDMETDRLRLISVSQKDAPFLLREFSDEFVTRYLFDEEPFTALADAESLVGFYTQPEPRAQCRWVLTRKEDGAKMGTCGFHCWDRAKRRCEIGYDLLPAYQGQGYMTEALNAALRFAEETMRVARVDAHIYPDNARSVRAAEKQGFARGAETVVYAFRGEEMRHDVYARFFKGGAENCE